MSADSGVPLPSAAPPGTLPGLAQPSTPDAALPQHEERQQQKDQAKGQSKGGSEQYIGSGKSSDQAMEEDDEADQHEVETGFERAMSSLDPRAMHFMDSEIRHQTALEVRFSDSKKVMLVPTDATSLPELRRVFPAGTPDPLEMAAVGNITGLNTQPVAPLDEQGFPTVPLSRTGLLPQPMPRDQFESEIAARLGIPPIELRSTQHATIADVMNLLYGYYRAIQRADVEHLAMSVDVGFNMVAKEFFELRSELRDTAQEVRQDQTEISRLQAVAGNWPPNTPPEHRANLI